MAAARKKVLKPPAQRRPRIGVRRQALCEILKLRILRVTRRRCEMRIKIASRF
jgi:hypothetical protein